MTPLLLASALTTLIAAQAGSATPAPSPAPAPLATPSLSSPLDAFGPDLKAWLDADKLQDEANAQAALKALQRRRAERNLATVDEVAGVLAGRAQAKAGEGKAADAAKVIDLAAGFAPDSAELAVMKAAADGSAGAAWSALDLASANPIEGGRVTSTVLLGVLIIGALFAIGFSFAILLRYSAVFSHDVAEGLPGPLKSIALFMAVLFLALPLAGFLGWGYLPFWWVTLFFIFQSKQEKAVTVALLVGLALSSLAVPRILHQRSLERNVAARAAHTAAAGATSAASEALVKERAASDASNTEWALLATSLDRRAGRFDEALAALNARGGADVRFVNNAAAIEFVRGNYQGALDGFTAASSGSLSGPDRATAFYNLSLAQQNTLAFEPGKESRRKGDAVAAPLLARYDKIFSFDKDGSLLQAPPDIVPSASRVTAGVIPEFRYTVENAWSRLTVMAAALLLFIPAIVRFRGSQSFSKQCPKCGLTFCWLCQTRSTSQDVCSQCHHLFVVKRGIPPAARAAKNAEITRYATTRALLHRLASLAAPGAGHLAIGHFMFGLPLLLVWALSAGIVVTVQFLAPNMIALGPLGGTLQTAFGALAVLTYVAAQAIKPRAPVVAAPPRRERGEARS